MTNCEELNREPQCAADNDRSEQRSTIWCYPLSSGNPYQRLLYAALSPHGFTMQPMPQVDDDWLIHNCHPGDVVHFHWPENIWRGRGSAFAGTMHGIAGLHRFLKLCRRRGVAIAWTLHNIEHHEGKKFLDTAGYRLLMHHSDVVVCHSQTAASALHRKYRHAGKIIVMDHGTYEGVYAAPEDDTDIRSRLAIPSGRRILAAIGNVRPYKGLEALITAAPVLDDDWHVVIAGRALDDVYGKRLQRRCPENMTVDIGFLSDTEFFQLHQVSDAIVLPYRKATTSGALLAAWSLNKPAIASDLPLFREYYERFGSPAITLFNRRDPAELARITHQLREHASKNVEQHIHSCCKTLRWDQAIQPFARRLLEVVGER